MKKRLLQILLCLMLALGALQIPVVYASETEAPEIAPVEIYTVQQLQAIAENPTGSYILMSDLDMTDVAWTPLDFSGSFDGNGHAIVNLFLSETGKETAVVIDGNVKKYEAQVAGLFGTLRGAEVKNLNLINVRSLVDADVPCMVGGVAGFVEWGTISDCTVTGTLELRAHDRMFGVGGIVGYGTGTVQNCNIDVTLICTDTDANTLDEQFLGGVFATGFMSVLDCEIAIDGYCSEFGYAHNGGITGMLRQLPDKNKSGSILRNNVISGKITFFECNKNRRAYCRPLAGEILARWYRVTGNKHDFVRDERKEYDVELRPELCPEPVYQTTLVEPGCDTYGYTLYHCDGCGYEYKDQYTLFQHTVSNWTVVEAPTTQLEGRSTGSCDLCGAVFERTEEKLEPPPTETIAPVEDTVPPTQPIEEPEAQKIPAVIWIIPAALGAALCTVLLLRRKNQSSAFSKKNHGEQ